MSSQALSDRLVPISSSGDAAFRSLERRLRFAAESRFLFDSLVARAGVGSLTAAGLRPQRAPDRLAVLAFELLECLRLRRRVPCIGEARQAILGAPQRISQHPRYRGYWYDPARHSMVGMHLGVDLIEHEGRFHVLELNLDAGIRPHRRALYASDLDPFVAGIARAARDHGFRRLVPYARTWSREYAEEWQRAGREHGVETLPCCMPGEGSPAGRPLVALPAELPPETLVVVFSSQHTPVDFFIADKLASASWLAGLGDGAAACVPTWERLSVPPLHRDPRWPNLVVKLSGWDCSEYVRVARVRDEAEARAALGLREGDDTPAVLGLGPGRRLLNRFTGRGRVLYQPFIPPPLDEEGCPYRPRLHLLVSPLATGYLSVHHLAATAKVPAALPFGVVRERGPYVIGFGTGARYRLTDRRTEDAARAAAEHVGRTLQRALAERFETGPASA